MRDTAIYHASVITWLEARPKRHGNEGSFLLVPRSQPIRFGNEAINILIIILFNFVQVCYFPLRVRKIGWARDYLRYLT